MSELFLHIGTHKTGTSALQRFFANTHQVLLDTGVLYPQTGKPNKHSDGHHLLAWSVRSDKKNRGKINLKVWDEVLDEIKSVSPDKVILSSEDFEKCSEKEITLIKEMLADFQVHVIVYLRNQVDFMVSAYKQQLKMGVHALTFRAFIEKNINRCNYFDLLNRWNRVFGEGQVRYRAYDKLKKDPGIVLDFLNLAKLDRSLFDVLQKGQLPKVNKSAHDANMQVVRYLNQLKINGLPGSQTGPFEYIRRSFIRGSLAGNAAVGLARPFIQQSLYKPEDLEWLRESTSAWNEQFFATYLDEKEIGFFAF